MGEQMNVEQDIVDLGGFRFECGEELSNLEIAYEAYGEFDGDNVVLVCHALTGSAHVAGGRRHRTGGGARRNGDSQPGPEGQASAWWNDIVGPGKPIDTNDYYVVCANVPGSCYGSTGPASENPETGERYGPAFPPVTVTDWTHAQRKLLDAIGVGQLRAVVGGSVGGMNVLEWAKQYPDDVARLIPIAAAPRLDAQCLGLNAIARRAITGDANWNDGYYDEANQPTAGLALARQIGHMMYLSKSSMARKFGRRSAGRDVPELFPPDPGAGFFPSREVESYLDYNAEQFTERFDANSYLYLSRAMDAYDLSAGYDSDADALAAFDGEALVMSFSADWHFTVEQSETLTAAFRDAGADSVHHTIDSDHGHDAFLVEPERVGPPLRDFLDEGVEGRAVTDRETDESSGPDRAPVHSSLFSR